MNPTRRQDGTLLCDTLSLDMPQLMQALSCGRQTAEEIAKSAGARMKIGKRVLYNTGKIKAYLDSIAG
ncbi:hypothetical protein D6855_07230 [Butyrivibrio sp. CB08]|uniref:DUF6462 family protein n=1 Tax=Butyrivibrio sp. CB08 TaxID=2364879 RepID=UPI000EA85339|nr:DUF6462 family protein [Butyrivibrio sp. CB08]RKM60501.1 hypothetical protein D6855_07230 [Butyrivibrio sp. CB08]